MHQRAKIDMNAVGGYQTSTFGNSDFIKSSNINNNSGSTNINIYANQEEIDYSDDSFNGLTAEDILQEKINWNKKQRERAIREKIEREQNEEIANIQQSIDIINNAIDAIDQELLEFDNLKNISSVDPSLANLFPACLYNSDSDYLDNLTDNEFEIILDILVRYGLESSDLDIAQFKEFVKSGKYLRMMLETTGSSMESLWCDNIERYLGESSNRRKDIGLYDPEEARKRDSYLNKELINIVLENVPGLLSEEDYALIYYIEYIADNYQGNGNAVFDDLKERLKESFENDTYEQFRAEIILQGKREVFRNNGYDYDEIKSGLEDATLQYFNGKIGDKAYRIYFTKIMTGNDNIYEFTINGYSGASNIRVPSIKGLENDFYLMIAEQYNDRAQQIKSEKAELNRMLTQYKNYKLECELLNLISTDDFEKYKKLDGVSIDSEYKEIMTNEELANYAYLYNKFGQDKAKQYITSKEEEFNSRVGLERAYDFISQLTVDGKFKNYDDMTLEEKEQLENLGFDYSAYNMLITGGKGLEEGFESFFEGLINVFNSDGVKSANDYERMYISMLLSSNWLLSGTYDITSSIGNMAFPMLISTLASIASANPTLGAAIGSTLMGLSSGGNSLEGMLQEGWSFQESFTYGVLTGLSETTLGFFLGGIPGLSKLDDIPGVKLGVKGFLSNMFKEGMEESTQSILEPYLKYLSTGVEQKINWEEVAKSGIYGMITSGLISGGKILIQGNYVSIDKLDPEAIEKIAEAQNDGIELEITEEILTDSIKAEEAVNNAMKTSTGAEVDAPVDMIANIDSLKQKELNDLKLEIQKEISSLDTLDPNYNDNLSLLRTKANLLEKIVMLAHSKGMTFKEYVESCGKITQLDEATQLIVNQCAQHVFEVAKTSEPIISQMMRSLETNGARLEGFANRFKSEESIARKISNSLYGDFSEANIQSSAQMINDSLRYTLILPDGNYKSMMIEKLSILKKQGYEINEINNKWGDPIYQGLNVSLTSPDGVNLELQFHTEASFSVKEKLNHQFYEIFRSANASADIKGLATEIMILNQQLYVDTINNMVGLDYNKIISGLIDVVSHGNNYYFNYFSEDSFENMQLYRSLLTKYIDKINVWSDSIQSDDFLSSLFQYYVSSDDGFYPGAYSTMNSLARNTLFSDDGKKITVSGTYGDNTYSIDQFEQSLKSKSIVYKGKSIQSIQDFIYMQNDAFKEINNKLNEFTLDDNIVMYRGVNWNALEALKDKDGNSLGIKSTDSPETILAKFKLIGNEYVDNAFMSASPTPVGITSNKPVVFKMYCESGTHGAFLENVGGFENEFLFSAGSKFDVFDVKIEQIGGKDTMVIYMKNK